MFMLKTHMWHMFHRFLYSSQCGRSGFVVYGSCNCPLVYLNFELSSAKCSTCIVLIQSCITYRPTLLSQLWLMVKLLPLALTLWQHTNTTITTTTTNIVQIRQLDTLAALHCIQIWAAWSGHFLVHNFVVGNRTWSIVVELILLRLNFVFYYDCLLLEIELLHRNCRVLRVTRQCFWDVEKMFEAVCTVFPLTGLPLHPLARRDQEEDNTTTTTTTTSTTTTTDPVPCICTLWY
jgi:hypothetical protein